ncbi:MAG: YwiC-like family protein [Nitrospinae bacterium]|nr:YwiC-like family protein [Nitrospinota bacterium]MBF0633878.1 YwiC-like family protein [Nitrospinota bacterium]
MSFDELISVLKRPIFPKEHGVWVTLIVPLVTGTFAVPPDDGLKLVSAVVFGLGLIAGVMAIEPLKLIIKPTASTNKIRTYTWAVVYSFVASACILPVIAINGRWGLVWFLMLSAGLSALKMWAGLARFLRTIGMELVGIVGLCLTAPAASYLQTGRVTPESLIMYPLLIVWFVDRLFTVRRLLGILRGGVIFGSDKERYDWSKGELFIHMGALSVVALIVVFSGGVAPWTAFFPFLLLTFKFRRDISRPLLTGAMQVGFSEMRWSSAFAILFSAAFWFKSLV